MTGLRIRHTDNCFHATVILKEKDNNERQIEIGWKTQKCEEKKSTVLMFNSSC